MKQTTRNAIARVDIMQANQTISRGTGFLVADGLVLTAYHVVGDRRSATLYPGEIVLKFPDYLTTGSLHESYLDHDNDWVLLRCTKTPSNVRPLQIAQPDDSGFAWETHGFPDAQPVDGMVFHGTLTNHLGKLMGIDVFQLFSNEAAAGHGAPVHGLSGAPVIVNDYVIGLLRFALEKEQQTVAGTLYACPMATVLQKCARLLHAPVHIRKVGPGTLWVTGALCVASVPTWYWIYNQVFEARFPAALQDPVFWTPIAILWLLASVWAALISKKTAGTLDKAITVIVLLIGLVAAGAAARAARSAVPSNEKYTVALFDFIPVSQDSEDQANNLRDRIREQIQMLEKRYPGAFGLEPISRRPLGDKDEKKNSNVSYWAAKRGCHFAVWARIRREPSGYQTELFVVRVQPFGRYINHEYVPHRSYRERLAANWLGDDQVRQTLSTVVYYWGLSSYLRGNYERATALLAPIDGYNAQFYAGMALYVQSIKSGANMLITASAHLTKALAGASEAQANSEVIASYAQWLGNVNDSQIRYDVAQDPKRAFDDAVSKFALAASIFGDLKKPVAQAQTQVYLARLITLAFAKGMLEGPIRELSRAEGILEGVVGDSKSDSYQRFEAEDTLAWIYLYKANLERQKAREYYLKATQASTNALVIARRLADPYRMAVALRTRGNAHSGLVFELHARAPSVADILQREASRGKATQDLEESAIIAEKAGFRLNVCEVRRNLGNFYYRWALRQTDATERQAALQKALAHYSRAAASISADWSVRYADIKQKAGEIHMSLARAAGELSVPAILSRAIQEFSEAITVLEKAGRPTGPARKLRASSFRKLAVAEKDIRRRKALLKQAADDEARAGP